MNRERECLIHIGTHKTGTSLFQQILFNDPAMRPGGASVYPRTGLWPYDRSHNLFGVYLWEGIRRDLQTQPFERVVAQMLSEAAGADRVIVSSEVLEKCPLRGNGRIGEFVRLLKSRGYAVRILYVIRRPDHLADAVFKQWVRDFDTKFCGKPFDMAMGEARGMNFSRVAEAWQGLGVDRIKIIPYADADPLLAVAALLEACGVEADIAKWRDRVVNPSLDGFVLRFKHFVNRFGFDREFNERLTVILDQLAEDRGPEPRLTMFSPTKRADYLKQFEEDWRYLGQNYGVDLAGWRNPATPERELFQPLESHEVEPALRWLGTADPAIVRNLKIA